VSAGEPAGRPAGDRLERAAALVVRLMRIIPPPLAWRFGGWCGELFAACSTREPRRAHQHLAKAYPGQPAPWIASTVRRTFRHAGSMALWTLATLHRRAHELRRGIAVEGADNLHALARACRRGEGTVVTTGHLGNWELFARVGSTLVPTTITGRRLRSPLADRLVQGARSSSGGRVIYQDAELRDFVRELRSGRGLAILPDQDVPRLAGVFVPWFGIPAYTPSGPAALALLTGVAVQPMFLFRCASRWVLHIGPRRRFARTSDREHDVHEITAWVMAYQEALVRRFPHQWVWWHPRWRTTPQDREQSRRRSAGAPALPAPAPAPAAARPAPPATGP
jgi:KDO2-lipid IV(A) lauroyltransferase